MLEGDEMICKACKQKISLYLDHQLTQDERIAFESHLQECPECKKELEQLQDIVNMTKEMDMEPLPTGYCKDLRLKLEKEKKNSIRKKSFWTAKKLGMMAAAMVVVLMVPLFLSQLNQSNTMNEMAWDSAPPMISPSPGDSGIKTQDSGFGGYDEMAVSDTEYREESGLTMDSMSEDGIDYRSKDLKIVKTGYLAMETETYDEFTQMIVDTVASFGGYIEVSETYSNRHSYFDSQQNRRIYLKSGYMRLIIPQEHFYEVYSIISSNCNVLNQRTNEEDMTKYYYDMEGRVNNLRLQEERLRALFDRAENIGEIMQIENELARVRTQIDSMTMELQGIDYRSRMSTIGVEIQEIQKKDTIKPVDDNLWQRAKEGFAQSVNRSIRAFENFVVWLFSAIPMIIGLVIFVVLASLVVKKVIGSRKNKEK